MQSEDQRIRPHPSLPPETASVVTIGLTVTFRKVAKVDVTFNREGKDGDIRLINSNG